MMNRIKNIIGSVLLMGLASCSQEAPFEIETSQGDGRILSSAINVELRVDEPTTRASQPTTRAIPEIGDFTVDFVSNDSIISSYQYSKLPEIVTLPAGEYIVSAHYGDNAEAAFNNPYYYGSSDKFSISDGQIIDLLDPILCTLANVRIAVYFDSELPSDSKVNVKVGESNSEQLTFTPSTKEDGYFKYVEGSNTLAATYEGTIDGELVTETKTYAEVKPGLYYRITFKLHKVETVDPENPEQPENPSNPNEPNEDDDNKNTPVEGNLEADAASPETDNWGFKLNATVVIEDLTDEGINVEPSEEIYLEDDRPGSTPGSTPSQPSEPTEPSDPENPGEDEPGQDEPVIQAPQINGVGDTSTESANVNPTSFMVEIISTAENGIEKFDVDIISDLLNEQELNDVGLQSHIDLINPGSMAEGLSGLGFPVGDEVLGAKSLSLSIAPEFLNLLKALGNGSHEFKFSVKDANGETVKSVIITYQ